MNLAESPNKFHSQNVCTARHLGKDAGMGGMNALAQIADRIGPLIDKEDENTGAPWPRGARVARTVA